MASKRRPSKPRGAGNRGGSKVVRRSREDRKQLDPELEPLARGDVDRLRRRRPPRGPRLKDPRAVALVPGVANRDARAVFDARLVRLQSAQARDDQDALGRGLAEMSLLRLWRGRSLTSLQALCADLLQLSDGEQLAEAGRAQLNLSNDLELSDETIAAWLRAEAALGEVGVEGVVSITETGQLTFQCAPVCFAQGVDAMARRLRPLLRDQE